MKFHQKIEYGPNILTAIDVLESIKEWEFMGYEDRGERLPAPVGFNLAHHPLVGSSVVFYILGDEWLSDQESFGRDVPTYKRPCTKRHLMPLFYLFDAHDWAPWIVTIHKPRISHSGLFYECEMKTAVGEYYFDDEAALYKNCMGMTPEKAVEYADSEIGSGFNDVDWTKGQGWDF